MIYARRRRQRIRRPRRRPRGRRARWRRCAVRATSPPASCVTLHDVAPNPLVRQHLRDRPGGAAGGRAADPRAHVLRHHRRLSSTRAQVAARGGRRRSAAAGCRARRRHHRLAAAARGSRVFARYSLYDQFGSPPLNGVEAIGAARHHAQHSCIVGVNVIYPAVPAARVPTRAVQHASIAQRSAGRSPTTARGRRPNDPMTEMMEETMKRLMLAVLDRRRGPRARVRPARRSRRPIEEIPKLDQARRRDGQPVDGDGPAVQEVGAGPRSATPTGRR